MRQRGALTHVYQFANFQIFTLPSRLPLQFRHSIGELCDRLQS